MPLTKAGREVGAHIDVPRSRRRDAVFRSVYPTHPQRDGSDEREPSLNLTDSAQRGAQVPAVRLDDTVLSYGALDDLTAQLSGLLREHGVEPGDRVGSCCPTSRSSPSPTTASCARADRGAMNVLLKRREVAFYLGDPDARVVLAWHEFADEAMAGALQPAPSASSCGPASSSRCWPPPLRCATSPPRSVATRP